jgi:tyrosinase
MSATTPSPTAPLTALRHRRDIRMLTTQQLADLRNALELAQQINDDRGYQHWAGIHGLPLPISCKHNSPIFLAWHRAYLYFFEKTLQDRVAGVTLPWWDWTHQPQGIPASYNNPQVVGQPNPLYDSPIQPSGRRDPQEQRTWREPGTDGHLATAPELSQVLANTDFITFQSQLEDIHGAVHMWVGGTMSDIAVAAYDPIFWAHHCMIDRAWYLWQLRHPGANPPANQLGRALAPFSLTVRQTLDITHLGYDYASRTTATAGPPHHG